MPVFDYYCTICEQEHTDILVKKYDDPILCPECSELMYKLPNGFSISIKNPWVTKMERKWGKQGDPYRDEEGKKRKGVNDDLPTRPGPKTKAMWKKAAEMQRKALEKVK